MSRSNEVAFTKTVPMNKVRLDQSLQFRAGGLVEHRVEDYRTKLEVLPPVRGVFDGEWYWIWDGNHRIEARRREGKTDAQVIYVTGTKRDAKRKALGANDENGEGRKPEDRDLAIITALNDEEEWGGWSDRAIAELCRVDSHRVAKIRSDRDLARIKAEEKAEKASGGASVEASTLESALAMPKPRIPAWVESLEPDLKKKAMAILAKGGEPRLSERKGKKIVLDVSAQKAKKKAAPAAIPAGPAQKDLAGNTIEHDKVREAFNRDDLDEFDAVQTAISQIKKRIHDLAEKPAGAYLDVQDAEQWADNLRHSVKCAKPFCLCPKCGGRGCLDCRADRTAGKAAGLGWMSKQLHDQTVPDELKVKKTA